MCVCARWRACVCESFKSPQCYFLVRLFFPLIFQPQHTCPAGREANGEFVPSSVPLGLRLINRWTVVEAPRGFTILQETQHNSRGGLWASRIFKKFYIFGLLALRTSPLGAASISSRRFWEEIESQKERARLKQNKKITQKKQIKKKTTNKIEREKFFEFLFFYCRRAKKNIPYKLSQ